jgi:AraC-like DNA-binding protein
MWREAQPRYFFPLSVRLAEEPYSGRIREHCLGPLRLFRLEAGASTVRRTALSIARGDPMSLNVGLQISGRIVVKQAEHSALLTPEDLSSWDTSRPFILHSEESVDMLMLFVPRALLGLHANRMMPCTARLIAGGNGIGALAGTFLRSLWDELDASAAEMPREDLAESALALVRGLHLGPPAGSRESPSLSGEALRMSIRLYIDEHLGDADLRPETIAPAHFISTRHLHKLFSSEQHTVSRWILERRLERVRQDLMDRRLAHKTIAAIARYWGLPNASHAAQLFRQRYGCTPRQMREIARAQRTGHPDPHVPAGTRQVRADRSTA